MGLVIWNLEKSCRAVVLQEAGGTLKSAADSWTQTYGCGLIGKPPGLGPGECGFESHRPYSGRSRALFGKFFRKLLKSQKYA